MNKINCSWRRIVDLLIADNLNAVSHIILHQADNLNQRRADADLLADNALIDKLQLMRNQADMRC